MICFQNGLKTFNGVKSVPNNEIGHLVIRSIKQLLDKDKISSSIFSEENIIE